MSLLTYIKDVQGGDVRSGCAQLVGCLHPDLIRGEEGEVARDVAGVTLLARAVTFTFFLRPVPPGPKHNLHCDQNKLWCLCLEHPAASEVGACYRRSTAWLTH